MGPQVVCDDLARPLAKPRKSTIRLPTTVGSLLPQVADVDSDAQHYRPQVLGLDAEPFWRREPELEGSQHVGWKIPTGKKPRRGNGPGREKAQEGKQHRRALAAGVLGQKAQDRKQRKGNRTDRLAGKGPDRESHTKGNGEGIANSPGKENSTDRP